MRIIKSSIILVFILCLALYAGCSTDSKDTRSPLALFRDPAPCVNFGPAKIDILPITSITSKSSDRDSSINAYICLIDEYDSQIKAPATFRFELFQRLQRSSDPKGKRLIVWPDIDLTDSTANSSLWQDFMRAYLFTLPLSKISADNCILHVTVLCPSGKRLTSDFIVRSK